MKVVMNFFYNGQVLELCNDNGTENINYKVKETLEALNIHHV
jgi:hypothetical protein